MERLLKAKASLFITAWDYRLYREKLEIDLDRERERRRKESWKLKPPVVDPIRPQKNAV
tara:strand:- start:3311 stop:3487 length:177 start_codon:yes stop_codon:yes gene_type:complete